MRILCGDLFGSLGGAFRRALYLNAPSPARPQPRVEPRAEKGQSRLPRYAAGLAVVLLLWITVASVGTSLEPMNAVMVFLAVIVAVALRLGRGPALLVAVLGAIPLDYFCIPPFYSFSLSDLWHLITLAALLLVAMVVSELASDARANAMSAQKREAHAAALCSLSQSLSAAGGMNQIFAALADHVSETVGARFAVLLASDGVLELCFTGPGFAFDEDCRAAAVRFYQSDGKARDGRGRSHCLMLRTEGGPVGVMALEADGPAGAAFIEHRRLVEAFANQTALALERVLLQKKAVEAQLLQEEARLRQTLLSSVSHQLRTPLASIIGTLGTVLECGTLVDEANRQLLLREAQHQAERLNRVVGNLLDMSRLEAGPTRLKIEPCDVQDLIGVALQQLGQSARSRRISVHVPADPPLVKVDFMLTSQILVNLLDNALRYSPAASQIEVDLQVADAVLKVRVLDRGRGIAEPDLDVVFEKFGHAGRDADPGGIGLGLAVCKGFVEAQGGRIWLEHRPGGGTIAEFAVPLGGGK
ncbi:MAG TPA: ATP-binding protein [Bryobacteraceae bacterium]|nr:ATP-binding protein [Bryobacteraceae bacterium]